MRTTVQLDRDTWEFDDEQPLGPRGGFGSVFMGRRVSDDAQVAVKRLHVTAAEAAHRELEIVGGLMAVEGRDHVMPVLDSGQDPATGLYFVVMPVAERSLQDAVRSGPLAEDEAMATLVEIGAGLMEVSDVVHRDLKPANILRFDGRWRIADFGIARFVEATTAPNTVRGFLTPQYAAPEQWNGERAGHATDVYALGCIAFTLVTGSPPFAGNEDELAEHHRHTPSPNLPSQDPRLASMVSLMLRKNPATRPTIERVIELLRAMIATAGPPALGSAAALMQAGLAIANTAAQREAERQVAERAGQQRAAIASEAATILDEIMRRFAETVSALVVNATVVPDSRSRYTQILLGDGWIVWQLTAPQVPQGAFAESHWDVVAGAVIQVRQQGPNYKGRGASLWFTMWGDSYRWIEVPYMTLGRDGSVFPMALTDIRDADLAASAVTHVYQHAARPVPIDGEDEASFHDRWITRLAQAATNSLSAPSRLPE